MPPPAERNRLREQLSALAEDEAGLRDDLRYLAEVARREEVAASDAVTRGDEAAAHRHLDALEKHLEEAGIIEAEIRVLAATLTSYREALEALESRD